MYKALFILSLLLILGVLPVSTGIDPVIAAQVETRPFRLPFADPPGPGTWMMGQAYGNTVGAHRQRYTFYEAGQGLHFGVDLIAACGYPVVSVSDGVVAKVDALEHGSAPHNLMIDHANGYASFYGHLLERPDLQPGQPVSAGEIVAKVGDPDQTCNSRPHLHLEMRNAGAYNQAYNPLVLIEADWDTLALVGPFSNSFSRDVSQPRLWQSLYDQPEVRFWGPMLNNYENPWPPSWNP